MAAPKKVDYARIEPDWRAGLLSPAQLAAEYTAATGVAVSHTAINKHFRKLGIDRDLKAKIQAKADSMVLQAMVTGKVSAETTRAAAEIINDNASVIAQVRLQHRKDIARGQALARKLFAALEDLPAPDYGKEHVLLASAAGTFKTLTDATKSWIALEREAFGMTVVGTTPNTYEQNLKDLAG